MAATTAALVDAFAQRAEATGARVRRVASWADVAGLVVALAGDGPVGVAPSLAAARPALVAALAGRAVVPAGDDPAAAVLGVPVGLVQGVLGVAETGSVLVSEDTIAERVVSMLTATLVEVVAADAVVASLDAAAGWLAGRAGGGGYAALLTGPSRTADIERSLTIGVQGPSAVEVVVLDADGERR